MITKWVLRKREGYQNLYVSADEEKYTSNVEKAVMYETRAAARKNRYQDEVAVKIQLTLAIIFD